MLTKNKLTISLIIFTIAVAWAANASVSISPPAQAQTTFPVQGAFITASGGNGYGFATTDSLGRYNITSFLDTGSYSVIASATGFIDSKIDNVNVTAGGNTELNIMMPVSGGISGKITDAISGQPIPNIFITAYNSTGSSQSGPFALTDSNGNYQIFTNLQTSTYNLTATNTPPTSNVTVAGVQLQVSSVTRQNNYTVVGTTYKPVSPADDFLVVEAQLLSGQKTDSVYWSHVAVTDTNTNARMSQSTLTTLYGTSRLVWAFVVTKTSKSFMLNLPESQSLNLLPTATGYICKTVTGFSTSATGYISSIASGFSVTTGAMTSNVNIALSRSGTITGTVTDSVSHTPMSNISICAVYANGITAAFATTNSTGKYVMNTDLTTGTYNITIWLPTDHVPRTVSGVSVIAGSQTIQDIELDPSGIISGRVSNTANGQPIADVPIRVTSSNNAFIGFTATNATGYYRMSGLASGNYTVSASYGSISTDKSVVVVQGQETSNVNFAFSVSPSGAISGKVTNSTGSPIAFANVYANLTGSTVTDSDGNYIISGLGTGNYTVTVSATGFLSQNQTGVPVTVNQVTANINFQLLAKASGRVSGIVQTTQTPIPTIPEITPVIAVVVAAATTFILAVSLKKKVFAKQHERPAKTQINEFTQDLN